MRASDLRLLAARLTAEMERLPPGGERDALAVAVRAALREADALEGLPADDHFGTVVTDMVSGEKGQPESRPPSLRAIAKALGCTHGFLSQARAGDSRIRRSWARKIAKWRKDLPATTETWPAGWAQEPDEE